MWSQWFHSFFKLPVESGFLSWCFVGRGEDRTETPALLIDSSPLLLEAPLPLGKDREGGQVTRCVHRLP